VDVRIEHSLRAAHRRHSDKQGSEQGGLHCLVRDGTNIAFLSMLGMRKTPFIAASHCRKPK
jgi:hypothetical protein